MYPVLFKFGDISVYSYGLMLSLAFLAAIYAAARRARSININSQVILDLGLVVILSGIIGARIFFILLNLDFYINNPAQIIRLDKGGLAVFGGVLFSMVTVSVFCRIRKINVWDIADVIAPSLALGQAIGRIGCFLNGCCYGKAACCFPGVIFPGDDVYRIPTQIYSSAGLLAIFVFLIWLRAKKKFDGHLFSVYLMSYSLFRCFMDNFRGDELVRVNGYTLSQVLSAVIFLFGACVYLTRRKKCVVK